MKQSNEGFGCFIILGAIGTVLIWLWQGITWPFRVLWRLFH